MSEDFSLFRVPEKFIARYYTEKDELPEFRSEFMRDRDRLMYATAFRRLAGKTQIYTVGRDDHKKNRLTHSLEVSQIARTIAIALGLNADLAEAIALGHDFGHTPFGHAGEDMLHEIMTPGSSAIKRSPFYQKDISVIQRRFIRENPGAEDYLKYAFGFKHNLQSVRLAAVLEDSYRGADNQNIGLNLTNYTLYGMMTHCGETYNEGHPYPNYQELFRKQMLVKNHNSFAWSFEAYIVERADTIAQWHHDLEDAMREGALPIGKICETIKEAFGKKLSQEEKDCLQSIKEAQLMDRRRIAQLSHIVVNTLVNDVVETSKVNLNNLKDELIKIGKDDSETIFTCYDELGLPLGKDAIITTSQDIITQDIKNTISSSVHHSRNVERMNEKGKYIIRKLFEAYFAHPQQLPDGPILHLLVEIQPDEFKNIDVVRENGVGTARVAFEDIMKNPTIYQQCVLMRRICDHIASMTDHYAIEEYNNLYG